jgi:hypothetical protein
MPELDENSRHGRVDPGDVIGVAGDDGVTTLPSEWPVFMIASEAAAGPGNTLALTAGTTDRSEKRINYLNGSGTTVRAPLPGRGAAVHGPTELVLPRARG